MSTAPDCCKSQSRMQVELLDRQKWNTPAELANEMFDDLGFRPNRKRALHTCGGGDGDTPGLGDAVR